MLRKVLIFVSIPSLMGKLLGPLQYAIQCSVDADVSIPSLMGKLLGRVALEAHTSWTISSQYPR